MPTTPKREAELLDRALEVLNGLPDVEVLHWRREPAPHHGIRPDAFLTCRVGDDRLDLVVEAKPVLKGEGFWAERVRALTRQTGLPVLLVATYVPRPTGERLAKAGLNFLDLAGNIHLRTPHAWLYVLGRRPPGGLLWGGRGEGHPLTAPAALRLVYALLARPEATWTVRDLAAATGVALGWTTTVLRALREAGLVRRTGPRGPAIVQDRDGLLDRWLHDYGIILRPRLVLGTFAPTEGTLDDAVTQWAQVIAQRRIARRAALGGTWGADALVHYYRGPHVVLYVDPPARQWVIPLRIVPNPRGPIDLLEPVAPLQWEGDRHTPAGPIASPLVLYAELLADPDPRAHELAGRLAETFPELRRGG